MVGIHGLMVGCEIGMVAEVHVRIVEGEWGEGRLRVEEDEDDDEDE